MTELDLNLLRVLDAMLAHRSVSAAARALGVSQPAVSLSLRRLRDHFRDELFVRQAGGMVPTIAAERLREPVSRALAIIRTDIMPAAPFSPETSDRHFLLSLSDLGDLTFLPDLVAHLRRYAPGVSIGSVFNELPDLVRRLADGSIDLALGHLTHVASPNLFQQTLFEQTFVCLVRSDHPQIGSSLSLQQYLAAEHAVVTQHGRSQELFEDRVRQLGHARRIALHSPHFMSVPLLVAQSDMITVVPMAVGRIYTRLLNLKMLPVPFDVPTMELKQFWHARSHTDPGVAWLREVVAELFRGRDPTISATSPFWSRFIPASEDE